MDLKARQFSPLLFMSQVALPAENKMFLHARHRGSATGLWVRLWLVALKRLRLIGLGLGVLLSVTPGASQTLVGVGSTWKYFKGTAEASTPTNAWRLLAFNDLSWNSGPAPFRYGDGLGGTLLSDMPSGYATVFLRNKFVVTNAVQIQNLRLSVDFDDGFVLWLNGAEIFRANAPANLAHTSLALTEHESGTFETYTLLGAGAFLLEGTNQLAVQGFNTTLNSDDFKFDLQLESTLPQADLQDTKDTKFNFKRGFYDTNFTVTITSDTSGATITYTLDGSDPRTSPRATSGTTPVNVLIDPDSTYGGKRPRVTPAVILRAYAYRAGRNPSDLDAQTYIFPSRVRNQTNNVVPAPLTTNVFWDTLMDQRVVTNAAYSGLFDLALKDIPTMSIVMDWEDLFGTNGVHSGNNLDNHSIEKPCSVELIYSALPKFTNYAGFQVNCGIKIQGGGGRWNYGNYDPKQSFTLMFQPLFDGPGRLEYPLFEAAPVNQASDPAEYNRIIVRDGHNKSWAGPGPNPRQTTVYTRDEFHRASLLAMAGKGRSAHGTFVHLYLNGLYWGLYNPTERPDHGFQAIYFGGDGEHYDSYKQRNGDPNGDRVRLSAAQSLAANTNTPYATLKEYVDTASYADFLIVTWASGAADGPQWYGGNARNPAGPVRFFNWDYEDSYQPLGTGYVRGGQGYAFSSANVLWSSINAHPEFRMELADRIYQHCFNDGAFTDEQNTNRWLTLCSYIDTAVIGESARWGDEPQGYREGSATPWPGNASYNAYTQPLNRNDHWYSARDQVTQMMATNTAKMLADLRTRGFFPSVNAKAPLFTNTVTSQEIKVSRLVFTNTFSLTIGRDGTSGTIYWTTNGVDPRAEGGAIQGISGGTSTNLIIAGTTTVRARVRNGTEWSPLHQLTLHAATNNLAALKLTEIMYHPGGTELVAGRAITNILGNAGGPDLGRARLRLSAAAPVAPFSSGDVIVISNSALAANNGTFTVERVSGADVYLDQTLTDENVSTAVAAMSLDGNRYEFIELKNTGAMPLNLSGARFTEGVEFGFPDGTILGPGQFFVLTPHRSNFRDRYPAVPVNGFYMGALNNGGERLTLRDYFSNVVTTVNYDDAAPWPVSPDGLGYSLTTTSANPVGGQDVATLWRASQNLGGSPGADDPVYTVAQIRINEALTHTDQPLTDAIELYNPTGAAVDLSGWYLTDNRLFPQRWQIPVGTTIPANGYLVINEGHWSGNNLLFAANEFGAAFSLSSVGEEVYLFSPTLGYSHGFEFEAAFNGVSFGRFVTSVGEEHFASQTVRTLGAANAGPVVGPVVISEIHYHPAVGGVEFIELQNLTAQSVPLYDPAFPTNGWKLGGVSFEFAATSVVLPPQGLLLLVAGDSNAPAAFRAAYNVPVAVPIFNFSSALDNNGETLTLRRPDEPVQSGNNVGEVPYVVADRVRFSDQTPWPLEADGLGSSLERINPGLYGNDPINWSASSATHGTPGVGNAPPSTPLIATDIPALTLNVTVGTNPDLQELNVWNSGIGTLFYRVTSTNVAPSVVPTPGTESSTDSGDRKLHYLQFQTAALPLGSYMVFLRIEDNGSTPVATNSPVVVPVTIQVVPAPVPAIGVSSSNLTIQVLEGSDAGAVNFNIFNAGDGTLQYTLAEATTWLSVSPTNGASVDAGDPRSHIVSFATAALAAGNYNGAIQVHAPGAANSPRTIAVSLEVLPVIPAIGLSDVNLSAQVQVGTNAGAINFNVFNAGNGTLNYTLTPQANWFSIAPLSGNSTSVGAPQTHTVTFNSAALPAGTYFSWIEVSAPGAVPAAAYLPVVLQVREGGGFTAYNDLSWGSGQLSNHITAHTTVAGGAGGDGGGELIDYATGQPAGAMLGITGGSWLGATHYVQGANANSGTDADEVFNGKVDCLGVVSYETNELVLTFSNLMPTVRYEVVLFGNRAQYNDRFTTVTLEGAVNFTNTSSLGATISGASSQTTRILNGNNTVNGYVARYAGIDPGADGVFTLRTLPGTTVAERYYVNALMLRAGEPPVPQVQLHAYVEGQLALTWDGAGLVLEEAPAVSGPWTPCVNQSAVQAIVPDQPAKFFRLRSP